MALVNHMTFKPEDLKEVHTAEVITTSPDTGHPYYSPSVSRAQPMIPGMLLDHRFTSFELPAVHYTSIKAVEKNSYFDAYTEVRLGCRMGGDLSMKSYFHVRQAVLPGWYHGATVMTTGALPNPSITEVGEAVENLLGGLDTSSSEEDQAPMES